MTKTIDEQIAELLELVDKVAEIRLKLKEMQPEVAQAIYSKGQNNWRVMRAKAELDIANEVDDVGKRKYPNEDTRRAAFIVWEGEHAEEFQIPDDVRAERTELDKKYDALAIEVDRLRARQEVLMLSLLIQAGISPDALLGRLS